MRRAPQILLIGNYPIDGQRSMQRFCAIMADGLRAKGMQIEILTPAPRLGGLVALRAIRKWAGYFDKFCSFPAVLRKRLAELKSIGEQLLVHVCDHSNARYVRYLQDVPHVVTCHDLIAVRSALDEFPGTSIRWTGKILQSDILKGISKAGHVVCDSIATRADVLRLSGLPETRVSFQYLSLDRKVWQQSADADRNPRELPRYILHVGSDAWYKNRAGVMKIYHALCKRMPDAPELVFVGPSPSGDLQTTLTECFETTSKIRFVDGLSDSRLADLYRGAEALLFPSWIEGFGWPVLEAQACGCPVLVSDRASLAEIGGEAVVTVPPDDPERAAGQLERLLRLNAEDRAQLVAQGLANSARFTVDKMIDGYLAAYELARRS